MIEVLGTGPLVTVQDLGRRGYAGLGVPRSGAADLDALRRANRLVGNVEGAACLEALLGVLRLRATAEHVVAVTGAPCRAPDGVAWALRPGDTLDLGPCSAGLRTYVGVRGGLDLPRVLGSRSTDVRSGLGPPPLRSGVVLPVGTETAGPAALGRHASPEVPERITVDLLPGPRADWARGGPEALTVQPFTVAADSDRVAVRLTGTPLRGQRADELPSEGLLPGAVQLPPAGLPIVFLSEHPPTGGYPVVAVVPERQHWLLAQARPGQELRFRMPG